MSENPTRLRRLRLERHMSQRLLAKDAGVSLDCVYRIENAQNVAQVSRIWADTWVRLGRALGVSAMEVFPLLGKRTRN